MFFLSCVCHVCARLCLVVTCWERADLLALEKRFWCLTVSLSLFHWHPGSGVVLDYIDS